MANDIFNQFSDEEIASLPLDASVKEQIMASRVPAPELSTATDPYAQMNIRPSAPSAPGPELSTAADPYAQVAPPMAPPQPGVTYMSQPEQNEVVADRLSAMQAGTPFATPTQAPTPLAPPHMQVSPQQQEQQMIADQQAQQAVTRQIANEKAQGLGQVQRERDAMKQAEVAQAKDAENEAKIEKDLEEDGPTWGTRIGQAIAILVGGISQGYSGARENPAIVAIQNYAAQKANAKKYTDEQKMKLEEMLLKKAQFKLEQQKASVDSMVSFRNLSLSEQKVQMELDKLAAAKAQHMTMGQTEFTREEMNQLQGEEGNRLRERLVPLPNGKFAPAVSAEDAKKLRMEVIPGFQDAMQSGQKLMDTIEYLGNSPVKKFTSPVKMGEAQALAQGLVGAMKSAYFGSGTFSDSEQALAQSIVGNPNVIFSLSATNKAKLQTVLDKIKNGYRNKLRASGVDLPLDVNEVRLKQMKELHPEAAEGDLINSLVRDGRWKSGI